MIYTWLAVLAVIASIVVDRWIVRTRLTSGANWWVSYAVIVVFQVLTNGWLTGRRIVQYDPERIIGDSRVVAFGHGRLGYAPIEDLGFGFALVLTSCVVWNRLAPDRSR